MNEQFSRHLETQTESRDLQWELQFLDFLANSHLAVLSPDPQNGPDHWPYLMVSTEQQPGQPFDPCPQIVQWLSEKGIGLVVNPQKDFPDFVLSYGMIWNFRVRGRFLQPQPNEIKNPTEGELGKIVHAGTPTEGYLPTFVRKILREFFRDQGVLNPKVVLISEDRNHYDLAFSSESLGNPPHNEWGGVAEAISWFLPAHYSVVIASEKGLPPVTSL